MTITPDDLRALADGLANENAEAERVAARYAASADMLEALKAAQELVANEFRDTSQGPHGEWVAPEARPAYEKITAAITKAGGPPSCPKCEALKVENLRLRKHVAEAHNKWRHEFAASVDEATNTLFKRLSAIHAIRSGRQP